MAVISEYSIQNTVTGESINIIGKLEGKPNKLRYNKKTTLATTTVIQSAGMLFKGTFTVDKAERSEYNKIFNAWKNGNNLIIQDISGERYYGLIEGEELNLNPTPNYATNTVFYTGSFNIECSYNVGDK